MVKPGVVCPLEQTLADAEKLKTSEVVVLSGRGCIPYPQLVPVVAVVAGPFTDYDGDVFFVVQLDQAGKWFTIAWPGLNTNLHPDARGQAI